MPRCARCSAEIPAGRHYCHPHYQEALRDHERELEQYQRDRQAWEALSPEEKHHRSMMAETDEVATFATLVGLGIGGFAWYTFHHYHPIDGLWGLLLVIITACFCGNWTPLRQAIGRPARACFVAFPTLLIAGLVLMVLVLISELVARHWRELSLVFGIVIVGASLIRELAGLHQTTGEPHLPLEPRA